MSGLLTLASMLIVGLMLRAGGEVGHAGGDVFTTIDDPGASLNEGTAAVGINQQGDIVGSYGAPNGRRSGFLLQRGHFVTLTYPHPATGGMAGTFVTGINTQGEIVGSYLDWASHLHGFLWRQGRYTPLDDPRAGATGSTQAWGINAHGDIVGAFVGTNRHLHGFLLRQGRYSTLDDPRAAPSLGSVATGINARGEISGYYLDRTRTVHGFLLRQNRYSTLDDPRAQTGAFLGTFAYGINDQGDTVGSFSEGSADGDRSRGDHGFVWHQGQFLAIDHPEAGTNGYRHTRVYGMNDVGDVVGSYTDGGFRTHGFTYGVTFAAQLAQGSSTILPAVRYPVP